MKRIAAHFASTFRDTRFRKGRPFLSVSAPPHRWLARSLICQRRSIDDDDDDDGHDDINKLSQSICCDLVNGGAQRSMHQHHACGAASRPETQISKASQSHCAERRCGQLKCNLTINTPMNERLLLLL